MTLRSAQNHQLALVHLPKSSRKCSVIADPKWAKETHPAFTSSPHSDEIEMGLKIGSSLAGKTPYEYFKLFFDDEVFNLITKYST